MKYYDHLLVKDVIWWIDSDGYIIPFVEFENHSNYFGKYYQDDIRDQIYRYAESDNFDYEKSSKMGVVGEGQGFPIYRSLEYYMTKKIVLGSVLSMSFDTETKEFIFEDVLINGHQDMVMPNFDLLKDYGKYVDGIFKIDNLYESSSNQDFISLLDTLGIKYSNASRLVKAMNILKQILSIESKDLQKLVYKGLDEYYNEDKFIFHNKYMTRPMLQHRHLVRNYIIDPSILFYLPEDYFVEKLGRDRGAELYNEIDDLMKDATYPETLYLINATALDNNMNKLGFEFWEYIIDNYGTPYISYKQECDVIKHFNYDSTAYYGLGYMDVYHYKAFGTHIIHIDDDRWDNKNVVFSGVRDEFLEMRLKARGAKISETMTKGTDIVIVKDKHRMTKKLLTAKEKGLEILSYAKVKDEY